MRAPAMRLAGGGEDMNEPGPDQRDRQQPEEGQPPPPPGVTATVPPADGPPGAAAWRTVLPEQAALGFLSAPLAPDEIGRLGGYRVLRVLGSGGMGIVFLAEDIRLQRRVALKVMKPDVASKPGAKERFLREARAGAALAHQNIVTVYQVDEVGGVPFLAMQYLQGMSLEERLTSAGPVGVREVLRLGRQIALGLATAHEHGLIHRDIKPANLWLEPGPEGQLKVLDFGLARAAEDQAHLTQSGAVVGTPAYMAPEQVKSEPVDPRTDLFSLGVVLYRSCTGHLPFPGRNAFEVVATLATTQAPPVRQLRPAVPAALADLVMQLLSKDPAGRPASARGVA